MGDSWNLKIILLFSNCHIFKLFLSLALLEAGVLLVDHEQFSFPLHDLAINTAFFNGSSNFHCLVFYLVPALAFSVCFQRQRLNYL